MDNEYLYERYGFKANNRGFFNEWRDITSNIINENDKLNRGDVAYSVYKELILKKSEKKGNGG